MASEARSGTSSCLPTAAAVLAKLGGMTQSVDQAGLATVWNPCMQAHLTAWQTNNIAGTQHLDLN